ncbi:hypothetical protein ACRB68_70210 [Actinomadura sp. RB68]|uniref:Beta-lactamase-related domain-containing protein n=1 Tax=Actinomadura macrotermitis TaxID=2585200 RepID=A0A7K0C634_9ACTN|nr:hypothetical protein [Actinomadura macrotermitis]
MFGHDGNTIGQSAVLRVDPGRDVAVAVLTNGGDRKPLMKEILGRVVEPPAEPGHGPVAFLGDDGQGRARYLHTGRSDVRAAGRTTPSLTRA